MGRRRTDTRRRILIAARNLYSSHGSEGASLDDVLSATGVTKGAFYHYFKSKDALCQAVIDEAVAAYQEHVTAVISRHPPGEALERILTTLSSPDAAEPAACVRLLIRLTLPTQSSPDGVAHRTAEFWRWHARVIEDLLRVRPGPAAAADPAAHAELLLRLAVGAAILHGPASATDTPSAADLLSRILNAG